MTWPRADITVQLIRDAVHDGDYMELWQLALAAGSEIDQPEVVADRVIAGLGPALRSGEVVAGRVYGASLPFEKLDLPIDTILQEIRHAIIRGLSGTEADLWFDVAD